MYESRWRSQQWGWLKLPTSLLALDLASRAMRHLVSLLFTFLCAAVVLFAPIIVAIFALLGALVAGVTVTAVTTTASTAAAFALTVAAAAVTAATATAATATATAATCVSRALASL